MLQIMFEAARNTFLAVPETSPRTSPAQFTPNLGSQTSVVPDTQTQCVSPSAVITTNLSHTSSPSILSLKRCPDELMSPIIDTSTPETLERDFNAWLKGELNSESFNSDRPNMTFKSPLQEASTLSSLGPEKAPNIYIKMEPESFSVIEWAPAIRKTNEEEPLLAALGQCSPTIFGSGSTSSSRCSSDSDSPLSSITDTSMNSLETSYPTWAELGVWLSNMCSKQSVENPSRKNRLGKLHQRLSDPRPPPRKRNSNSCTNRMGRNYSPGLPLSMEERNQIVEMFTSGVKICDISKKLCVTHSCVSKILNRFHKVGSVQPQIAKENRQESPLVTVIRDYHHRLGLTRQSEIKKQLIHDQIYDLDNLPTRSSINHILRSKLNIRTIRPKRKKTDNCRAEEVTF